jgi:hypothetical protein
VTRGVSSRPDVAAHSRRGQSTSSVSVVVESPDWSRQFSGRNAAQRNPNAERITAWMVTTLVFGCGGLALFDLYLLLSGFR